MTIHARHLGSNILYYSGHRGRLVGAVGPDVYGYEDDFVKSPLSAADSLYGWTVTLVEAGAGESTITHQNTGKNGSILITTDNLENDGVNMTLDGESFQLDPAVSNPLAVYFGIGVTLSEATQSDFMAGLVITDTDMLGGVSDGIYLRKVDGSTALSGVIEKNAGETAAASTYTMTTGATTLEFYYEKSGVTARTHFWAQPAGGALSYLGACVGANHPDDEPLTVGVHLLTGAGAIVTATIDWIRVIGIGRA